MLHLRCKKWGLVWIALGVWGWVGCARQAPPEPAGPGGAPAKTAGAPPAAPAPAQYKIGFANLTEDIAFCADVRESLERAAQEAGNVELVLANNRLDGPTALANARNFVTQGCDLVIEFQTDEKFGPAIMEEFNRADIPVIAIDIPMPGAIYFGANNYQAGRLGGEAAGRYAKEHWGGQVDKILSLELPQSGDLPAQRMKGQIDGVRAHVQVPDEDVIHLDSKNTLEEARRVVSNTLSTIPDARHLIVVCINDGTALGAIAALEAAQRQQDAIVVSQNADPTARAELRRPGTILLGSVAYFPEKYGDHLIPLALKKLKKQPVPDKNYVDHVLITRDNVDQYYPE